MFIAALFTITKTGNKPNVYQLVNAKQIVAHTYNEIMLSQKKAAD